MDNKFEKYLDKGTNTIIEIFSSPDISTAERNAIASTFTTELANHIGNTDGLSDSDLLIYTTSVQFIDGAISSILSKKKASYTDYESGIQLCTRQKQLLRLFCQKGWAVPALQNPVPDNCAELLRNRQESISMSEKILDESKRIGVLLVQAKKEYSTSICDQAISLINELEQDLAICKQKRITIPPIDSDPQWTKRELSELRTAAEKKETAKKELDNNHAQIRAIISSYTSDVEQWKSVVALSKRQSELIEECKRNKWPVSTTQYGKPELFVKQYQHYLFMLETDALITREMGSVSSNKQYKQFFEHCTLQQNNIDLCLQNGWRIPKLTNTDPNNLINAFQAKKNKRDKRKRSKRWILLFALVILTVLVLAIYGINKYRSGKVVIPFSASYAAGQDLDSVYSQLHEAGFKNITKKSDTSGWYKDNEVRSVTIDNSDKYSQGSYKSPDVSIVITYSSSNRVYVTDLLKGWKAKGYSEVENVLRKAGFTNITLRPVTTTDKEKEDFTVELSLNSLTYTNEYCYLPISAPIVISYYTLQIGIGNDNSEFIGQNYENVVDSLRKSGFTNIQTQVVTTGWAKGNTVVGVTVNNVDTYSSGDLFAPDIKIVVKYSSDNRVDVSDIVKKWQTTDYAVLVSALKSKGFSTIKVVEKTTETKSQNRLVSSISFDDSEYIAGDCYLQKTASICIEYYSLKIKVGRAAKDFADSDLYSDVVSQLKNMGFTNIRLQRANDLVTGWISKEGTIKTITINGQNDFSSTDSFKYDVEIIIVVHTWKNKGCEDITEIAD